MIKISVKGPTANDLLKAATAVIEKDLASKAKAAALRHGGVTVRFKRSASGGPASMELQGSDAAIAAAQAALQR
ncbi:hypothetical protein [Methylibium sp.]|uniref:hypothetical protein n=1 Tax=Methylibium sp. TaxID=2067992 RepID=UPI003D144CAE